MNAALEAIEEVYNVAGVWKLFEDATFYVSPSGSDDTGDGSLATPFLTPAKALSQIPVFIGEHDVQILLADGTYNLGGVPVGVYGFQGGGTLKIASQSADATKVNITATGVQAFYVRGCGCVVSLEDMTISGTGVTNLGAILSSGSPSTVYSGLTLAGYTKTIEWGGLDAINEALTGLAGDVTSLGNRLTTAESTIAGHTSSLTSLDARAEALELENDKRNTWGAM
jgi:hypothetical protein